MNERIRELEAQCWEHDQSWTGVGQRIFNREKFAELIVGECIQTLEFHGFNDAIPYIKWMAANRFGVKE